MRSASTKRKQPRSFTTASDIKTDFQNFKCRSRLFVHPPVNKHNAWMPWRWKSDDPGIRNVQNQLSAKRWNKK